MTKKKDRAIVARALKVTGLPLPVRTLIARGWIADGSLASVRYGLFAPRTDRERAALDAIVIPTHCECCGPDAADAYVSGPKGNLYHGDLTDAVEAARKRAAAIREGKKVDKRPALVQLAAQAKTAGPDPFGASPF